VDVHTHLELTVLRGSLEETDFFRWIRRLTRTKYEILDRDDLLVSALAGCLEATRAGVTTVGEVCDLGVAREALELAGLRAVLFQEVFGPDPAKAQESLAGLRESLALHREALRSNRITLGVSPHAPYTVSAPLFQAVTRLALEERLPMTTHAAESRAERDFVRDGTGPFARFLESRGIDREPPGCSTIAWLDELGCLEAKPLLVHAIQCDAEDLRRIVESGSAVAHCPKSNAKLGHGIAPFGELRSAGATVGLGSDSVASNNSLDLLEEARFAALIARGRCASNGCSDPLPTPRDILRLATLDGARALGLDAEIGSLEVGKRADLIAVDLAAPNVAPVHDPEAAVAWSACAANVVFTAVEGEILFERDRYFRLSTKDILERVEEIACRIARAGES
ncbi:MAG TPA: amidohydrolase family protein, partial [Planctomycetota bacterium]|nr:amidohydrolase family protein [Planctomycetota bacterium]